MEKINGIIIDGKVYEAVPKGSYHCSDCDLYKQCKRYSHVLTDACTNLMFVFEENIIFRYSQPLTDKINER